MRGYLRVVVARVVGQTAGKRQPALMHINRLCFGSFLPKDQRELDRDMRAGAIGNDANRVILGRPGCFRATAQTAAERSGGCMAM